MSYLIIKKSVEDQSKIEMQNKFEALMKTLDYALSHTTVTGSSLPEVLQDEIYQIADINKHDVIIYDLDGNYLVSNKEKGLVDQKRIPQNILEKVKNSDTRYDVQAHQSRRLRQRSYGRQFRRLRQCS
jgi:F0F1-type ATP synthase alpha subunit